MLTMFTHTAPLRLGRTLGQVMEQGAMNAGTVTLNWNAAPAPSNPNDEDTYAPAAPQSLTTVALIHWISARTISRGYTDYLAGDVLVTFEGAMDLSSLNGLTFLLPDGLTYVQQAAGKGVDEFWDVIMGGERMTTTVALRPNPGIARVATAFVNYVDESGTTRLYLYDPATRLLQAVDPTILAATATIAVTATAVSIFFGSDAPVYIGTAEVVTVEAAADGPQLLEETPRLDFFLDGALVGQIGGVTGTFAARLIMATGVNPRLANPRLNALEFSTGAGNWVTSLAIGMAYVPGFSS